MTFSNITTAAVGLVDFSRHPDRNVFQGSKFSGKKN